MATIRTERLLLRPAQEADCAAMHAIMRDPRAMAYWSTPPHDTLEQTRDWLAAMIAIPPGEGEDFILEHEGRVIGKAGLYRFPDIGYMLAPDMWGQGLASEALRAVIARAFEVHGLTAITADVDPRNEASIALLTRLGFAETHRAKKTWQVGGEWCDSVYFALEARNRGASG